MYQSNLFGLAGPRPPDVGFPEHPILCLGADANAHAETVTNVISSREPP
jgi:hypothetical protein